MNEATLAQTIMTLLILIIFLGLLIWGIKSKQFHNVEDAKYRMLDEDHETSKKEKKHQENQR
jgi:cbb3-type cytochrome oxidase maturation protein